MEEHRETIVISVGGSLVVPHDINLQFLSKLKDFICEQVERNKQFVIVVGGGSTARKYQEAVRKLARAEQADIDRIGITAIKLNVHMMRLIFQAVAPVVINPDVEEWEPGHSSDHGTVHIAQKYGAKKLINLSNVDYVYDIQKIDETGRIHTITDITWNDFIEMLPSEWTPGANVPFDPRASELARDRRTRISRHTNTQLKIDTKPFWKHN
jgi:uridylate kinase